MRFPIAFSVVATLIILLTGCGQSDIDYSDEYVFGQDDQYYLSKSTQDSQNSFAESEDGYYFFGSYHHNYLYFMDKDSMEPVLVCSRPECNHDQEQDPMKTLDCDANFYQTNHNLLYYDGNLYTVGTDPQSPHSQTTYLWRISLDATTLEPIKEFSAVPAHLIVHRGSIFYTVERAHYEKDGEEGVGLALNEVPLADAEQEPEVVFQSTRADADATNLMAYGNGVYFGEILSDDENPEAMTGFLHCYDLQEGTVETLADDVGNYALTGDRFTYISTQDMNMYSMEMDGSDRQPLELEYGFILDAPDHIYLDTLLATYFSHMRPGQEEEFSRELLVYDTKGNLKQSIDISQFGTRQFLGGNESHLFLPGQQTRDDDDLYPSFELWLIEKESIVTAPPMPEKIYAFEPEGVYPGVEFEVD